MVEKPAQYRAEISKLAGTNRLWLWSLRRAVRPGQYRGFRPLGSRTISRELLPGYEFAFHRDRFEVRSAYMLGRGVDFDAKRSNWS